MRTTLTFFVAAIVAVTTLIPASSAFALCTPGVALIGTITSVTNQGASTRIHIDHNGRYDASSLPVDRTDIDAYHNVVKAYRQNANVVPPNMKPVESSIAPQGYKSWDEYYTQNYAYISVPTDALARAAYQVGDIVLLGPPGGASCTQYGFTGFFTREGVIKSAIATDNNFLSYSYGGEALTLAPGTNMSCMQDTTGTRCQVPVTYTVRGTALKVNPGESKVLNGTRFSRVSLVASTHTTLLPNIMVEDFSSRSLLHVLSFSTPAPVVVTATSTTAVASSTPARGETFEVSEFSGPASLRVTFGGRVSNNDAYSLDFGDRQPASTLRCAVAPSAASTTCDLRPVSHTYSTPGTFIATLTDIINPCATASTSTSNTQCTASAQRRTVGTATITVTPAQPKQSFKVWPKSGSVPHFAEFYGPTDGYTYSIDFGDGDMPAQYWGPSIMNACRSALSGPAGCVVAEHTYTQNGSYLARLLREGSIVATIPVTVSSGYRSESDRPSASCPIITRTLMRGSRGFSVTALQKYLVSIGILDMDAATGYYGSLTQAAVAQWQAEQGLEPLGIVGPRTRAALAECGQ